MKHKIILILLVLPAIILAGCGEPVKTAAPASPVLTGSEIDVLMAAAQETLGQMHFIMDKYDIEAGYIRTRPQRAGQFFEPWRTDNASAEAFGRANVDSLRRVVEVFVEPEDGVMQLRCVVSVEKLSLPPQPIRSMSRLAGMYTDSTRTLQTLALEKEQLGQMEWVALGPDHALEERIITQIEKHLRKG